MNIAKNRDFILRGYRKNDAESIATNINNKKMWKNMSSIPYPYRVSDAMHWIKLTQKMYRKKNPEKLSFVIEIDKKAVGGIGLHDIKESHMAMLGYWLGEDYWGKGIMTKAVKEITKYGFNKLKLKRIYAGVFTFNKASMRVLEKAGYQFEGILKKDHYHKGMKKYLDTCLYAKIK